MVDPTQGMPLCDRLLLGNLSSPELLKLARSVADYLRVRRHGDIRPSKIVWGETVSLIDEDKGSESAPVTVRYLSPEQAGLVNRPVGLGSDLFSLGIVLYEAATGNHPFPALELRPWLQQLATQTPPSPGLGMWDAVICRLLQKQPADRYPSVESLLEDLLAIEENRASLQTNWFPLREPEFVGREQELALLDQFWIRAQSECLVVAIEGSPGVGKSALLSEFSRRRDSPTWESPGGSELPWQPLLPLVDAALKRMEHDQEFEARFRSRIASFEPILISLFPKLAQVWPPGLQPQSASPHECQLALAAFLTVLGPGPVFIEDAHWISTAMQELLLAMHNQPSAGPLMLVCSYRPEVATALLLQLPRVAIPPLPDPELRALLQSMAGQLPEAVLEDLQQSSQGNPFLAISQLRGGVEQGALSLQAHGWSIADGHTWQTDRESSFILKQRIQSIGTEARRWLSAGAILGRTFSAEAAQRMSGSDGYIQCLSLQLIRSRGELVHFQHDLVRESLLLDMQDAERVRWHRLAARATSPQDTFAQARHLDGSCQYEAALLPALESGRQALERQDLDLVEDLLAGAERGWNWASRGQRLFLTRTLTYVYLCRLRIAEAEQQAKRALELSQTPLEKARALRALAEVMGNESYSEEFWSLVQEAHYQIKGYRMSGIWLAWDIFKSLPAMFGLDSGFDRVTLLPEPEPEDEELGHLLCLAMSWGFQKNEHLLTLWAMVRGLHWARTVRPSPSSLYIWGFVAGAVAPLLGAPKVSQRLYSKIRPHLDGVQDYRRRARALAAGAQANWLTGNLEEGLRDLQLAKRAVGVYGERYDQEAIAIHTCCALTYLGRYAEAQELSRTPMKTSMNQQAMAFVQSLCSLGALEIPESIVSQTENRVGQSLAFSARGLNLWRRCQFENAADWFHEAAKLSSRHICVHCFPWQAECYRRAADSRPAGPTRFALLRKARKAAKVAVSMVRFLPVTGPQAYRELGHVHRLQGDWRKAEACMRQSLELATEYAMPFEEALTRVGLGQLDIANAHQQKKLGFRLLAELNVEHPFEKDLLSIPKLALEDRFSLLLEAGRRVSLCVSPDQLWSEVVAFLQHALRPEQIGLFNPAGIQLAGLSTPVSPNLFQEALRSGSIVFKDEDISLSESLYLHQIRSSVCAPIKSSTDEVKAVVVAHHSGLRNFFGDEELRILQFLCSAAGSALDNYVARSSMQAAFEGAAVGMAVLDCEGVIVREFTRARSRGRAGQQIFQQKCTRSPGWVPRDTCPRQQTRQLK